MIHKIKAGVRLAYVVQAQLNIAKKACLDGDQAKARKYIAMAQRDAAALVRAIKAGA